MFALSERTTTFFTIRLWYELLMRVVLPAFSGTVIFSQRMPVDAGQAAHRAIRRH